MFTVNSSTGAITTALDLDFETAKSHTVSLTATVGSDSTTTAITIPVENTLERQASLVRYSGDFFNPVRSGLTATASRGHVNSSNNSFEESLVGLKHVVRGNTESVKIIYKHILLITRRVKGFVSRIATVTKKI